MMLDDARPTITTTSDRASSRNAAYEAGAAAVLSGVFYLYIWRCVGLHLLYHQQCPVFITTLDFFKSFLGCPGGVVGYVSAFLTQFCYYPWVGALAITVVAGLICLATRGLLRAAADRPVHPAAYLLPLVLLAVLHGRYKYQPITSVAVLAALAFANVYVRTARRSAWVRLAAFAVLSVIAYYTAGGAYVVFAASCGVFELARKRAIIPGLVCLACAPAVPYGFALYSYDISLAQAWMPLQPFRRDVAFSIPLMLNPSVALYVLLLAYGPLATLWMGLVRKPFAFRRWLASLRRTHDDSPDEPRRPTPFGTWTVTSLVIFLIAGAALTFLWFDAEVRTQLEVDYYAGQKDWKCVLEAARRLPPELYPVYIMHDVNRALYHTGGLLSHMFSYPQRTGMPSVRLSPDERNSLGYKKFAELCLELGRVNFAQHWAHHLLEIEGHWPSTLILLTRTNILKGRPQAARTFLGALRDHLLFRHRADDYLKRLDEDPITAGDEEIERIRPLMLTEDFGYGGFGGFRYADILQQLLRTNRDNRMAFEYLMAYCLLSRQLDLVVQHIQYLSDFDYKSMPQHLQEAVVVYGRTRPAPPPPRLHGWRVSDETVRRCDSFLLDVERYRKSHGEAQEAALETLVKRWGSTYFFYYLLGFSEPRPGWRIPRPDVTTGAMK